MKRVLKWMIINLGLAYCLFAWVSHDYTWAENIFKFFVWVHFIVSMLIVFVDDLREKAREKGRSVHKTVSHLYDAVLLIALVGWGSVFYGILFLLQSLFQIAIYDSEEKESLDEAKA